MALTLSKTDIDLAAGALDHAERSVSQTGLLSLAHPGMTMDDAYAVQSAWVSKKKAGGNAVRGWKIGLTSKAMQAALNITTPDSGVLFDDMFFDDGGRVPAGRFIQPRIEAEIAFYMDTDLEGDRITVPDVLNATAYIAPAIEILDTRIVRKDPETGTARTVLDTICDNAANAGIVVGGRALRPPDTDLRWIGAIASKNGTVEETGLGAGVLNSPALSVAWLANRLARYGDKIRAGDVVLSGSFIRPIETAPGDTLVCDFGQMGSLSLYFEQEAP